MVYEKAFRCNSEEKHAAVSWNKISYNIKQRREIFIFIYLNNIIKKVLGNSKSNRTRIIFYLFIFLKKGLVDYNCTDYKKEK